MPTRQNTNFPRLKSDEEFENLLLDLCRLEWNDPLASDRHGRSGQNQDGVDIFGHPNGKPDLHYGTQCKLRTGDKQPTKNEIETEVERARKFTPPLSRLIIVTDAPRDVHTQEIVRQISDREILAGSFSVSIWFWDSICQRIETYPDIIIRYFRDYISILTTAPNAEHLASIPLHLLSVHSGGGDTYLSLDEALELRGIQVCPPQDLVDRKFSPDGVLLQYHEDDTSTLNRFAALLLRYSLYDCPTFVVLPNAITKEFSKAFDELGGSLKNIRVLDASSSLAQLINSVFEPIFKYGYRRRGSLTTLDLSIHNSPGRASKAFLDINWSSRIGPSQFPSTEIWESVLAPALKDTHRQVAALGESVLVQIRPVLHLPVAFAWGFVFNVRLSRIAVWARETGESELEKQRWLSDAPLSSLELSQEWYLPLKSEAHAVLVELSNGRDIHSSVISYVSQVGLAVDAWLQIGHQDTDSRFHNIDQDCAVAYAAKVGQIIRSIRQSGVTDIHLFLSMPSALAILVGQRLQSCGRIHLYWYTNPSYQYAFVLQ